MVGILHCGRASDANHNHFGSCQVCCAGFTAGKLCVVHSANNDDWLQVFLMILNIFTPCYTSSQFAFKSRANF